MRKREASARVIGFAAAELESRERCSQPYEATNVLMSGCVSAAGLYSALFAHPQPGTQR